MIAMALLIRDKLYYREIDENEKVNIGSDKTYEMVIPGLKKRISVIWRKDYAEITIAENTVAAKSPFQQFGSPARLTAKMGEITVIDYEDHIAISFAYVSKSDKHVYFDNNSKISIGRSEKKARDGSENTILVKLPFVSSRHMEIISQNGKLFVRDNGSTNGTFVN